MYNSGSCWTILGYLQVQVKIVVCILFKYWMDSQLNSEKKSVFSLLQHQWCSIGDSKYMYTKNIDFFLVYEKKKNLIFSDKGLFHWAWVVVFKQSIWLLSQGRPVHLLNLRVCLNNNSITWCVWNSFLLKVCTVDLVLVCLKHVR